MIMVNVWLREYQISAMTLKSTRRRPLGLRQIGTSDPALSDRLAALSVIDGDFRSRPRPEVTVDHEDPPTLGGRACSREQLRVEQQ